MFDWLGDFFNGIGDAIGGAFNGVGTAISEAIWEAMLQWYYETIYNAIADFFTLMGNMGADLFDLAWVQATINLFVLFGWALYVTGIIVAVFDVAIEYQSGRANIKTTALNILKEYSSKQHQRVFVISHRPDIGNERFDRVLCVEKTDGIAHIVR